LSLDATPSTFAAFFIPGKVFSTIADVERMPKLTIFAIVGMMNRGGQLLQRVDRCGFDGICVHDARFTLTHTRGAF
jgi:hypothetical protein